MSKIYFAKKIQEIISNIDNKNSTNALKIINLVLKNQPNFDILDWEKALKMYEDNSLIKINKEKIFTNIGVFLFKLGKINQSINIFKSLIKNNPYFVLAHNNLGISYLELGMYKKAIHQFVLALKLNEKDFNANKNLINILSLSKPDEKDKHPIIDLNKKINNILYNSKNKDFYDIGVIKNILEESISSIKNVDENLFLNETQILRKNNKNLNCLRHFKVFNRFNIIPKFCFNCYKVQINLLKVVDLIKLYLMFNNLYLENDNQKKCMVETRSLIKGNYKGYIYCEGLADAQNVVRKINKEILLLNIQHYNVIIKHGCSEFYKSYPQFEKINYNGDQEMIYNNEWKDKENLVDEEEPIRLEIDKKIISSTLKEINLSDILIIKNWMSYANAIGDKSYREIYNKSISKDFGRKVLGEQLEFRKTTFT